MKLNKIKFARLVAWISTQAGYHFNEDDLHDLDDLTDIELPEQQIMRPSNDDIERLMALMAEGTRKIEAIKIHRSITGLGLKESKDAVERYWVSKPDIVQNKINEIVKGAPY